MEAFPGAQMAVFLSTFSFRKLSKPKSQQSAGNRWGASNGWGGKSPVFRCPQGHSRHWSARNCTGFSRAKYSRACITDVCTTLYWKPSYVVVPFHNVVPDTAGLFSVNCYDYVIFYLGIGCADSFFAQSTRQCHTIWQVHNTWFSFHQSPNHPCPFLTIVSSWTTRMVPLDELPFTCAILRFFCFWFLNPLDPFPPPLALAPSPPW